MNETTDRHTDRDPRDAKRQTQHMVSHTRSKAARMANVLRADTMHVAVVHQAAVDVWCVLCTFCLWRHGCCSACMLSLCPCLRSACGSPEDLGDLPSYAAARPTRCPLKRMFMTYTLQSLARCAHPCEVGNAIDRDEASRAADKVAFERHLDITPQILLHLGSSPCRLVIDRQRFMERSVPALDMKSMSARFD